MDLLPEDIARAVKGSRPGRPTAETLGEEQHNCAEHGDFTSSGVRYLGVREIWTKCPDCEEAERAKARMATAVEQAEREHQKLEEMIGAACIPRRFIGRTLENFVAGTKKQRHALEIAREFAEHFEEHSELGGSLVFAGMPGTGKSHLAMAILQALMPRRCGVYITAMGLIRAVRETWRRDSSRTESQVFDAFGSAPLLVIDEIGVQYGTDGEQTLLFEVLDRRYREMRPTILLTNQDKAGLRSFIGERAYDRMTECARWVPFDWPSHRAAARLLPTNGPTP